MDQEREHELLQRSGLTVGAHEHYLRHDAPVWPCACGRWFTTQKGLSEHTTSANREKK